MFTFKVIALSALLYACASADTDADKANWIFNCGRKSIVNGVPELNIPSHNPYVFTKGFNVWANSSFANTKVQLKNVVWNKLADFTSKIDTFKTDGNTEVFNVSISWENFSLEADYTASGQTGKISAQFSDVDWTGIFTIVKNDNVNFEYTALDQYYSGLAVKATNNQKLAGYLYNQIVDAFNIHKYNSIITNFLNESFGKQPERVEGLIAWCKKQEQ